MCVTAGWMAGQNSTLSIDCDSSPQWEPTVNQMLPISGKLQLVVNKIPAAFLSEHHFILAPATKVPYFLICERAWSGRTQKGHAWHVCWCSFSLTQNMREGESGKQLHPSWCDAKWPRWSKGTVMQMKDKTRLYKKMQGGKLKTKHCNVVSQKKTTCQSSNCSGVNIMIRIERWVLDVKQYKVRSPSGIYITVFLNHFVSILYWDFVFL